MRLSACLSFVALAAAATASLAVAQTAPDVGAEAASAGRYLNAQALDTYRILPPAPVEGTVRYESDRKVFAATRKLKDTPRWALAQNDDNEKIILSDYACSLGFTPTPQTTPLLVRLIDKVRRDVRASVNQPKDIYKRQRPYLIDSGDICVAKTPGLASSPDYPSGHTTWGWTTGLILAELVPDHATDILVRARAYGESRVVCGVHNASAIEAGRTNAALIAKTPY